MAGKIRKINELVPHFKTFLPAESIERVVETLKTSWIGGDGPRVIALICQI